MQSSIPLWKLRRIMVCSYYNYWVKATGASASVGMNVAVGKDDEGSPGLPIKLFTWHISCQMKATFSFIHEKFISNQMGYVYDGDRITVDEWVGRCPGVLFMCWRERFFVSDDLVARDICYVCVCGCACVCARASEFFSKCPSSREGIYHKSSLLLLKPISPKNVWSKQKHSVFGYPPLYHEQNSVCLAAVWDVHTRSSRWLSACTK